MPWAAAAAVVAAGIGAASSKNASDKQVDATKKGLSQTSRMAEQSRQDAIQLYNQGRQAGQTGLTSAFNFYKQAAPSKYAPITQSSVAAQRVIGKGATQANNAILGLPVDMSFTDEEQINPDLSFLQNAQLPEMTGEYLPKEQDTMENATGLNPSGAKSRSKLDKIEDPLNLKDPLAKKVESYSPGRKLVNKLF